MDKFNQIPKNYTELNVCDAPKNVLNPLSCINDARTIRIFNSKNDAEDEIVRMSWQSRKFMNENCCDMFITYSVLFYDENKKIDSLNMFTLRHNNNFSIIGHLGIEILIREHVRLFDEKMKLNFLDKIKETIKMKWLSKEEHQMFS